MELFFLLIFKNLLLVYP